MQHLQAYEDDEKSKRQVLFNGCLIANGFDAAFVLLLSPEAKELKYIQWQQHQQLENEDAEPSVRICDITAIIRSQKSKSAKVCSQQTLDDSMKLISFRSSAALSIYG